MRIDRFIFSLFITVAASGQTGAQVFPGLQGQPLLDSLAARYKPATTLDYGQARDSMFARVYNSGDSIACVYSGYQLYLPPGEDPTTWLYMNGSANGINTEHTWPQSKGAVEGNPKNDMHHLFPVRTGVNIARDNFPFADIPDSQTTKWYRLDQELGAIPTDHLDEYSERANGRFEPREDHKGNVARAMFYFYTMYRAEADAADPLFFAQQRETLCAWHYLDPADSLETARTWLIAYWQDGKPNPFVLDCTLPDRSYCDGTPGECPAVTPSGPEAARPSPQRLAFAPNPTTGLFVPDGPPLTSTPSLLTIADLASRPLLQRSWAAGETVSIHDFPAGIYIVILENEKGRWAGLLVKE